MPSFNHYEKLYTPLALKSQTLRNRVIFSPMVSDYTNSLGEPTQGYIDFVEEQARSGVALIHLGATPVNWKNAADYPAELDVTDDKKLNSLVLLAKAAHRHGAKLSVELLHAGRGVGPTLIETEWGIAPSNFPLLDQYRYIREMNQMDMDEIIADYVDCALRLKRAQFDGVLIHAAHGNLLGQFLSPATNHRTDWYGGSLENRARFPLMIIKAVREAVGDDFILDMRVSGDEEVEGGIHIDQTIEFIKMAQDYLDMVNISRGLIVDWRAQFFTMPPYYQPHLLNVGLARQVKQDPEITIPITTVGRILTADEADQAIVAGDADGVYIARALLADTELLKKSYAGQEDTVRPCIGCFMCADGGGNHISCTISPQLGRGHRYWEIRPALTPKKVVIVGGGPAGMMAAQTAVKRGHDVVLFEREAQLGGLLHDIDKLPFKEDLRKYADWSIRTTMDCGADVRLGVEATPEIVMAENPDAILVAIGGEAARPPIPGLDDPRVASVRDVDSGRVKASGKVVVCGAGSSGCESAIALAMAGCDVALVDMIPFDEFAQDMTHITREMLVYLLKSYDIALYPDHVVKAIEPDGVHIESHDWRETVLEADLIVDALGFTPKGFDEFAELIPEVHAIGDANGIGDLYKANHGAFDCVMDL